MVAHQNLPDITISDLSSLKIKILTGEEIIEAKKLVYQVFVLEQNWKIPPDNPTRIRVESGMLCDMYDAIATWFGVFHNNTLIACGRACGQLREHFEMEHYQPLLPWIKSNEATREVTRLAIQKEYRSTLAVFALNRFGLQHLIDSGVKTIFTTSSFPKPGRFYVRMFGFIKNSKKFRYHTDDPHEVHILHMDENRMQESLDKLTKHLERKS
ncbi:MAG: hypothetical protein AB4042_07545 [Leptolyngbyaceae cyanobacterium]